jgi:hypothetical protein
MSIIAATVKVAALAVTFTCLGARRPISEELPSPSLGVASSSHLQCRMYFGCMPAVSLNTTVAQRQ